jgi:UDP-N-acetylmuramoylalanine--D-glutamate ligase
VDIISILKKVKTSSQSILVVGLGISGVATARVLCRRGYQVTAIDKMGERDVITRVGLEEVESLKSAGVRIEFSQDGESAGTLFSNIGLAVLSPGISLESAIVGAINRRQIPICNELELAVDLIGLPTIVVTGSNGKSTTVTLIHEMLRASGLNARLCGNVGIPVISLLDIEGDSNDSRNIGSNLVIEASSYQLETCYHLKPNVAVWLNISDNHLERHGTIERYLAVKSKIFALQSQSDISIVNIDDERAGQVLKGIKGRLLGFGRNKDSLNKNTKEYGLINFNGESGTDKIQINLDKELLFDLSKFPLQGIHNRYDAAAALLAALGSGADPAACQSVLNRFTGLRHRYQLVGEVREVRFINDSKSTTVAASCAALASTLEQNPARKVHLMLGGMVKAGSWHPLINLCKANSNSLAPVVCFGGDGRIIHNHLKSGGIPTTLLATHTDGFRDVAARAKPEDIVLFSPGCASFDEFQNFEKRGDAFEKLVRDHANRRQDTIGDESRSG